MVSDQHFGSSLCQEMEGKAGDAQKDRTMSTFISLVSYTEQGAANIKDSPERLDAARELAESMGGELTDWFLTFGEHDAVVITEFPDDETCAQFALAVSQMGSVTTTTQKAFTEEEYRDVIADIPEP